MIDIESISKRVQAYGDKYELELKAVANCCDETANVVCCLCDTTFPFTDTRDNVRAHINALVKAVSGQLNDHGMIFDDLYYTLVHSISSEDNWCEVDVTDLQDFTSILFTVDEYDQIPELFSVPKMISYLEDLGVTLEPNVSDISSLLIRDSSMQYSSVVLANTICTENIMRENNAENLMTEILHTVGNLNKEIQDKLLPQIHDAIEFMDSDEITEARIQTDEIVSGIRTPDSKAEAIQSAFKKAVDRIAEACSNFAQTARLLAAYVHFFTATASYISSTAQLISSACQAYQNFKAVKF